MEFFAQMNIASCCRATYYNLQQDFINNIIWGYWMRMQENIISAIRACGAAISLSGDGQYDSPGFSAAYCFYR